MKLGLKLLAALLLLAVVPVLFVSRYATSYFHHYTKTAQEEWMAQSARVVGGLFQHVEDADARREVVRDFAEVSGRRYRVFDAEGALILDEGDVGEVAFGDNADVAEVLRTGAYAARWWIRPDRSRLFYFTAVPIHNPGGELLGVAQAVEHTSDITLAVLDLYRQQGRTTLWVTAGAVGFALLFAYGLTRRLRRLRGAAADFARGGDPSRFVLKGGDEVTDLATGFREMAEELKRRQAYNREFVLTTLHELKTPLTAIHGAAEILQTREALDVEDRRRFAGNIRSQSDRLLGLVRDLRTLTSLDVDLPVEKKVEVDAVEWLRKCVHRVEPGLRHRVEVSAAAAGTVKMIPARMEQALINLLHNADRYHEGEGPLRARLEVGDGEWRLWVEDDGPGIPAENLDRVFDRYFTTATPTAGGSGERGRGLGLAVVKRIVEHHGGRVEVRNRAKGGASVGFSLP